MHILWYLSHTQDSAESLERPFLDRLQQQASIKQQLVTVYVNLITFFELSFFCCSNRVDVVNVSFCSEEGPSD